VAFITQDPNQVAGNDSVFGVLELTLGVCAYSGKLLPVAGESFMDSGTAQCPGPTTHGAASS